MTLEDMLRPATEAELRQSLARVGAKIAERYGQRLRGLYLFGSRARGDHGPHSDVDVAVILADGPMDYWAEANVLSDFSYDELVDQGVDFDFSPVSEASWNNPASHDNASLVHAMKRNGQAFPTATWEIER